MSGKRLRVDDGSEGRTGGAFMATKVDSLVSITETDTSDQAIVLGDTSQTRETGLPMESSDMEAVLPAK